MLASIGIVCLDEFDKIASGQNNAIFAGAGTTKDVTGMGVQRELLKMLEASEVVVPLDLTHSSYADHVVMSTADIAFIAAGAFSGFQQIAHRRAMRDSIGFGRDQAASGTDPDAIAVDFTVDQVENVANFQAYGFLPELVARFTRVVPFKALDASTLIDILRSDVVARMTREFKLEGFELAIEEPDARPHRRRRARPQETGARGLTSTLTRDLEDVAFGAFGGEQRRRCAHVAMRSGTIAVDARREFRWARHAGGPAPCGFAAIVRCSSSWMNAAVAPDSAALARPEQLVVREPPSRDHLDSTERSVLDLRGAAWRTTGAAAVPPQCRLGELQRRTSFARLPCTWTRPLEH